MVVTPAPLGHGNGGKDSNSDYEIVTASVNGENRMTTLTLPVNLPEATDAAKNGGKKKSSAADHVNDDDDSDGDSDDGDDEDGDGHGDDDEDTPPITYTESNVPLTFIKSPVNYFYAIYLPVLLAVTFQMLATYLYTATKMMEPFAMLSQSIEGIPAKDFLWINYLSANDSIEPFTAMISGHWQMLWVSILFIAAQLLSPLSSEVIGIYPGYRKISEETVTAGVCKLHPTHS